MPRRPRQSSSRLPDMDEIPEVVTLTTTAFGPPSTEEEKQKFFADLIRLKMHRWTNLECAQKLGVSERTIQNYLADPLYHTMVQAQEAEAKTAAHLLVSDMAYAAMNTLRDLMDVSKTKSEYVRYSAARTVGEWLGLNVPKDEVQSDAQEEVAAFLERLQKDGTRIQVNNIQVNMHAGQGEEQQQVSESVVDALPPLLSAPEQADFPLVQPGGKMPENW